MKTLSGKVVVLWTEGSSTIEYVKSVIPDTETPHPDLLQLTHAGKKLESECTLNHYNIENEATLLMSLRMRDDYGVIYIQCDKSVGKINDMVLVVHTLFKFYA